MNEHYRKTGIEPIDVLYNWLSLDQYVAFCVGNVLKYVARHEHKGQAASDLKKAISYLDYILDALAQRNVYANNHKMSRFELEQECAHFGHLHGDSFVLSYMKGAMMDRTMAVVKMLGNIDDQQCVELASNVEQVIWTISIILTIQEQNNA
jgi:hypothetical protein